MKIDAPRPLIVAVPLALARSALFAAGHSPICPIKQRRLVPIAPQRGARLLRIGPPLGQQHALAWQAVLHWAADAGVTGDLAFTVAADELLRLMGRKGGDSDQRARLVGWLHDLAATRIRYRTTLHTYVGPLLREVSRDKRTGRIVLRLPAKLAPLLSNEILRNDLGRKCSLGQDALALWLHDYIATHLRPPLDTVDALRVWSGSGQELPHFRYALRRALRRLAPKVNDPNVPEGTPPHPAPGALVLNWRIDRHDRLHIEKAPTSVAILPARTVEATKSKHALNTKEGRHEIEVARAREQRAKVAL